MPTETTIRSFWNRAAEENPHWYVSSYGRYDADRNLDEFWASGRTIWSDIKRVIGYTPESSDTVVEIGCGVGRLTRVIAPEVGRVMALDISEKMLAIARQANLPNVDFRVAQGFALPGIPDRSVNLSLGYCVFQHLPSLTALKSYLSEMHRVTKPGGTIAFTLTPRNWKTWLLPVLRLRAYLREHLSSGGPKGVYRKEWVGIRPSTSAVSGISPIQLQRRALDPGRILYFGRT
ncbi:MAG TPA: class I SAM-dependent methyltransferase [Candidatus Sulfotelmatobacter sp.]|nr:class I SAM-dependent methyltransferase [Candidatus Acidoferrales bacterium]HEV2400114.1 class I SAM-dependent methyltransferase [Candidatus Sulfotelmatobacter sp.]